MEMVFAAAIAAIPATIAAAASWRNSRAIRQQTQPSNGSSLASIIEKTERDVQGVKTDLAYHITIQHGRGPVPAEEE